MALPLARPRRSASAAALALASCGALLWIAQILAGINATGIPGAGHGIWMLVAAATLAMVAASVSWAGAVTPTPRAAVPTRDATAAAARTADAEPIAAAIPRRQTKSVVRKPSAKVTTGS